MEQDSRSDHESYEGHLVVVRARGSVDHWTYEVDVQTPDGQWWPPMVDHDNPYPSSVEALRAGMTLGREQVDQALQNT